MAQIIYADANATYPVPEDHYLDVARALKTSDGNPSSIHAQGRKAKIALEQARERIALMIGAKNQEVVFTSGATESNNMAIHGVVYKFQMEHPQAAKKPHVILSNSEHPSMIEPAKLLQSRGLIDLDFVGVDCTGAVLPESLLAILRSDTCFIGIMSANNETGRVNDVMTLASKAKSVAPGVHFHTDAVQMMGKYCLTWIGPSNIDSASFSGHKIGAFKGVGAIYLKQKSKLAGFMAGGGQERGRRPGTENIPGILSFGLRCQDISGRENELAGKMLEMRQILAAKIARMRGGHVHGVYGNGVHEADSKSMLPNTVHFHIDDLPGDDILLNFDLEGIQVSSGSACSSGSARPSQVVIAMGYSEWVALNSIRISLSDKNSLADIERIGEVLESVSRRVRGYV